MKNKILLFAFAFSLLFISCSDNEDPSSTLTNSDIVGTWNVTAQTLDLNSIIDASGQTITFTTTSYGKDFNMTYVFSENPNNVIVQGSFTSVITTSILGQTQTQEIPVNSVDNLSAGTWSLTNNLLTNVSTNGETSVGEIIEHNANLLKIKVDIDYTESDSGTTTTFNGTMFLTLEK